MSRNEIFEKLNQIFRDTFDDESIELAEGTSSSDIEEWDSFMHINIIAQIEDEFSIQFPMEAIMTMKTVGDLVDKIIFLTK